MIRDCPDDDDDGPTPSPGTFVIVDRRSELTHHGHRRSLLFLNFYLLLMHCHGSVNRFWALRDVAVDLNVA